MSGRPNVSLALALAGLLAGLPAWSAQSETGRASVPPGTSVDGAAPSGGAIVGGSIQRSENKPTPLEVDRCRDLEGTLKVQCLRDARNPQQPPLPRTSPESGSAEAGTR